MGPLKYTSANFRNGKRKNRPIGHSLRQWFPNFSGERTTGNILVVREEQNIDLNRDSRTTSANIAEQTLGITALREPLAVYLYNFQANIQALVMSVC